MSRCSNCGSETTRVRSRWSETGTPLADECPFCRPEGFEKVTDPSDKKIWMGYEAHPNEYVKKEDKDGIIYERKPEYRAEQEAKLQEATEEEKQAQERAIAEKRATRRTLPMDAVEMAHAMHRAEEIAAWINHAAQQGTDVN